MKDADLNAKLKVVRVPERDPDYWEMFPRRVMARSRATTGERVQQSWLPRLAWGSALATICLLAGCWVVPVTNHPPKTVCFALVENMRSFHTELTQIPGRVRNVMQIEHGLHSLIEEQP